MLKKFLLLTIIFYFIVNNYSISQIWEKVPGTHPYVNLLKFSNYDSNKLFVGSDLEPTDFTINNINFLFFGYGFQISTNSGVSFSDIMLGDYSVFDIIESPNDNQKLLISARKQDLGRVFMSSDGGNNWDVETKRCEGSSQITRFYCINESGKDIFYSASINSNAGLKYSDDYFISCITTDSIQVNTRDICVSEKNPKIIYLVADNVSKQKVLVSRDGGKIWKNASLGLENYRILSVKASPTNEGMVVVGADSISPTGKIIGKGIFMSSDYGETWNNVGGAGCSVYDIQYHPSNPKYWAASGGDKGVLISGTGGDYWEISNAGLPANNLIRKIAIPNIEPSNDGIIVFASVYGDGIYKSKPITTSIKDNEESSFSLSPNPASDYIVIQSSEVSKTSDVSNVQIYNTFGLEVISTPSASQPLLNVGNLRIDISNLPAGVYFIKIGERVEKFVKM